MATDVIHLEITGPERQRQLNSNGHFDDACLCGNGSFHARKHFDVRAVTCQPCLEIVLSNPDFLDLDAHYIRRLDSFAKRLL